jgi:hypothetical protein
MHFIIPSIHNDSINQMPGVVERKPVVFQINESFSVSNDELEETWAGLFPGMACMRRRAHAESP